MFHAFRVTSVRPPALVLAGALGALGALAGFAVGAPAAAGSSAAAVGTGSPAGHVVIAGVAGLHWADVSTGRTPTLARIARAGAVGSLSVRSAPAPPQVTCPGEGWLTIGAGTYAALVEPGGTAARRSPAARRGCTERRPPVVRTEGDSATVPALPALGRLNDGLRFRARPGLLGDTVDCAAAVGPGAGLAAADRYGHVDAYAERLPADPGPLLGRCPLALVDLGAVAGSGADRDRALAAFDAMLGRVDAARPPGSVLFVLGIGAVDTGEPRLQVAAATGPGFTGGWLRSPSTRRSPYVQLCDVAPTALSLLGRPVPDDVAGRPLAGGGPGRPERLDATVAALIDTDAAAAAQRAAVGVFFAGAGLVLLVVCAALAFLLYRRRRGPQPRALRWLGVAALGLAAVPAGTFVANLVPWWRSGGPALAVAAAVAVAAAGTVAVAYAGPWRRTTAGPVVAMSAAGVLVFAVDALTGTTLQINSLLGYNPLVAGRFTGFGNIAFAVFGTAAVLLAALAAAGRSRWTAAAIVAAVAVPVVVLDGMPAWGADFGGVLTLVPVFVVVALLATGARVNGWRLLGAGAAAVFVVGAIALVDHQRPAATQSHFGRFVSAVLDGSAGAAVWRKVLANVDLLLAGPHTIAALVLVALLSVGVFRPPPVLRRAYEQVPALRTALVGVVALGWIGFATNDSGVAVPLVAALVAVPAALAVCARAATRGDVEMR